MNITPNQDDISTDMNNWAANDPDGAEVAKFQKDLTKGDGNAMCHDVAQAVREGKLTKQEAADIGSGIQQAANANGGGKINKDARNDLSDALDGQNVLAKGNTRIGQKFVNFFKGVGNFFQGLGSTLTGGLIPPPKSDAVAPPVQPSITQAEEQAYLRQVDQMFNTPEVV
jgi:hypothetical protein